MDSAQQGEQKKGEEEKVGVPSDPFLAVIMMILSIGVIVLSLRMPRPGGWISSPGIFPLLSAIILLGLSIGLFFSTVHPKKIKLSISLKDKMEQGESRSFINRTILAAVGILVYICVLIPIVHFTIATFLYLVTTLWYFWRGKLYKILILSACTTLFLSEVFRRFFQIILP